MATFAFSTKGKAPGVYIQEITLPGPIQGVGTNVAAFVGPASKGPLLTPTPLTSAQQFFTIFGDYVESPYRVYAAHAVNGFFAEGGTQCYFVRVGNGVAAWLNLLDGGTPAQNTLRVTAQQEGTDGNNITVKVDPVSGTTTTVPNPTATPDVAANQLPVAVPASTSGDKRSITVTAAAAAANFGPGDLVNITSGATSENAAIASIAAAVITFTAPLANSYNAGTIIKRDRITVTAASDAAGFLPGNTVVITQGANTETATIVRIVGSVIIFQAALKNTYTGGSIALPTLGAGSLQFRVASTTGLEAGTYIGIDNTVVKENAVIANVNPTSNVVTLASGLTNTYPMGTGAQTITITPLSFTLTIVSTAAGTETFANLSMDPRHSRYFVNVVNSTAVAVTLADPPSTSVPPNNMPAQLAATILAHGAADNLKTITTVNYENGIDALKKQNDVNMLCVPDAVPNGGAFPFTAADTQAIQAYMVAHCEHMKDRFAILDCTEVPATTTDFSSLVNQRQGLSSSNGYGAFYFPWIAISNPFGNGRIFVPPSGYVGGVYANNDNNFGVFKAPANEQITSALAPEVIVTDDQQGPWNDKGINVIRTFPNQGVLIWGARTIAPPDITAWRFVNVRRLVTFIEKSIQEGTRFAVFEPNNQTLWQQIKRLVTAFLSDQWAEGALFGDTPDQAFRVQVDEALNPPEIRALGQLIVQVTVVPTTPAEFIVFQVIQDITGASLQESTT